LHLTCPPYVFFRFAPGIRRYEASRICIPTSSEPDARTAQKDRAGGEARRGNAYHVDFSFNIALLAAKSHILILNNTKNVVNFIIWLFFWSFKAAKNDISHRNAKRKSSEKIGKKTKFLIKKHKKTPAVPKMVHRL
jgi:hypothetical protein